MDNGSHSVTPFNKEFRDIMKWNELSDIKAAAICVIIVLNVILNSLVIAVIARYPQLREDRTTLFMFSLSVADLHAHQRRPVLREIAGNHRRSWFPSENTRVCDVVVWLQFDTQPVLADNLQSYRHLETFQSRATSHSKTLLHNHWNELDYWLPGCYGKLHSEPNVESRIMYL